MKILCLKNVTVIKMSPENINTKLSVIKYKYDVSQTFNYMIEDIRNKSYNYEKTIIFCRSIEKCA